MKIYSKIIAFCVLFVATVSLHAQQSPMYTHYMYNTLSVNPAYAGSRDALTITALHRSQWVGFKGAPMTQTLTLHSPLKNDHYALGLTLMNDRVGPINNTTIMADFAYRIKLSKRSRLAFGISAGIHILQAKLSPLELNEEVDPVFQNNINSRVTPNVGFGIYYAHDRVYVGVSAPDLLQNNYSLVKLSNGTILVAKEKRHYFLIAGMQIKLHRNLDFKPTMLVKATAASPIQADFTAAFVIRQKLLLGAMIRIGDAIGGLVGIDIHKQFHLGYSFDWSYGLKTAKYNYGSHELVLRYDFLSPTKKQIHSPRYF